VIACSIDLDNLARDDLADGVIRSTRLSALNAKVKARLSLSTSSALILPSLNILLIGIAGATSD
jgi:hypothetical protein